ALADDGTSGVATPTWYRDIEPLVTTTCAGCHTDSGIAPFALTTYQDFVPIREAITEAVDERRMPPWQPADCCNHYRWDRSLSDAERNTLLRWLRSGMALGDIADQMPVPAPPTGLPRVDLTATMHVPFIPQPKIGADEIRCFLLDHDDIPRDRYITGFDFKPGVRGEVHHIIVAAVDEDHAAELAKRDGEDGRPGWDCWGDGASEFGSDAQYIGGWQPGVLPRLLPDGVGRKLPAHTRILLNVHYDTGHGIAADQSSIDIMLEDHVERVERGTAAGNPLWFIGDGMEIPAGAPDTKVWFAWDPTVLTKGEPIHIHNVMLHMHELGSIGRVAILRADGSTECLLNIPDWDFHWMADYYFETPVVLSKGDQLYVECHWDNTQANQKIVNGHQQTPKTIHWGTDQEMCGAVVTYSEAVGSAVGS
ncbi:MAG TPA: hypothetical protein VFV99_10065, partial [Kofleriaceae bacterium]|nr:hypothetical protein [Kofleriaceae bacterium]